jgi:hypothetical protein
MGNAGSPYGHFRATLKHGSWQMVKEAARELPRIGLDDALMLTLMALTREPEGFERLALRWLEKFIGEGEPTLEEIVYAAELLRDVEPDGERVAFDAIKPMLRAKLPK